MDTVKQSLAAIVGSVLLAGCLNNANFAYVPSQSEAEDDSETAAAWSSAFQLAPERGLNGEVPQDRETGILLARSALGRRTPRVGQAASEALLAGQPGGGLSPSPLGRLAV